MRDKNQTIENKSRFLLYVSLFLLIVLGSCGEEKEFQPLFSDGVPPQPISNIEVTNGNGKAWVSYEIPNEKDLAYVLAKYEPAPGVKKEVKSSIYSNFVLLEGFSDSADYNVELFLVDKGELQSTSKKVTVTPNTPDYQKVQTTVSMISDFGGPQIQWFNKNNSELLFFCFAADSTGVMQSSGSFVSTEQEGAFTIRGFDDIERRFGVVIQDQWQNRTDTIFYAITPKLELELDRSLWKLFTGFKDNTDFFSSEGNFNKLRDNKLSGYWKTTYGANPPYLSYTIDLGVEATFSRIKMYHDEGSAFTGSRFKIVELYGSNELLPEWEHWTMLHNEAYTVIKPSGLPGKNYTEEDRQAVKNGFEIMTNSSIGSFRYLRIKYIENFEQRTASATCAELRIFGEVISE